LYVSKGPVLDHYRLDQFDRVLADLENLTRAQGAIAIKVDPDIPASAARVDDLLRERGWRPSAEQVQFKNTLLTDLTPDVATLLARLKPKTRYNIGLAERKGVKVIEGGLADLRTFFEMYAETAARDEFAIRPFEYYRDAWSTLLNSGRASLLLAELDGEVLAGVVVARYGRRAWYLYGASRARRRDAMPTYLVQWRSVLWARQSGCQVYDWWGAPDRLAPADRLWGVYRFKVGFGASFAEQLGAYDYVARPTVYALYRLLLPRVLAVLRRLRRVRLSRPRPATPERSAVLISSHTAYVSRSSKPVAGSRPLNCHPS
jgi:lipid II:glycine glycyltransferase (peptidoglycan interpeptide bridge formation enzyme)